MIRYLTAGESHGPALTVIIEGVPAGLSLDHTVIEAELLRRKKGYGRGGRQLIETDEVEILSGLRFGQTLGSPIAIVLRNKDHAKWLDTMAPVGNPPADLEPISIPRPGHADFAGLVKYERDDIRDILERSSARETAMRVVAGAIAKAFLTECGITIAGYVSSIGTAICDETSEDASYIKQTTEPSDCRTLTEKANTLMKAEIDAAMQKKVSLGGVFTIVANGLPIGLGSHVHWDRKLDAKLAMAVMSIQAIKGVEFGLGFEAAKRTGDQAHDAYMLNQDEISRPTNHAGGLEGGMTNGMPLVIRAAMKPIPTMQHRLPSVDLATLTPADSHFERADSCAVPAASVVAESVVAIELANALLEKFGGDSIGEVTSRLPLS
jgi:chorismate synthase